jgi:hypothetical protein
MQLKNKLGLIFSLLISTIVLGQTPGFNYQALILNNVEIQIPGTNVKDNKVALSLEDVVLRFTITNEASVEYIEDHTVTTDENGMVSLIVGEGTPIIYTFQDIIWDGKLKYLNVELNIPSNNEGFVFLDTQKILYIPHPTDSSGSFNIKIVNTIGDISPPFKSGDLIWVTNYGPNSNPTLMIFDGTNWRPVNDDYDPKNEFGLLVVKDDIEKATIFATPVDGNQVWNKACECIQVYIDGNWVSISTLALNGLTKVEATLKLGGNLIEPTTITTTATNTIAFNGLQQSTSNNDVLVVADKNTGVLKQKQLSSLTQQKEIVITAIDGQLVFTTPLNITSKDKIDVYRNGVRIDFTTINNTSIKLEPEAICYKDDKIRIVQLY